MSQFVEVEKYLKVLNDLSSCLQELERFVSYYRKNGSHRLGNGEAFQHYDRCCTLLKQISAKH